MSNNVSALSLNQRLYVKNSAMGKAGISTTSDTSQGKVSKESQILSNNKYEGIEVNISKDAQRLLRTLQQEEVESIEKKRFEEFAEYTSSMITELPDFSAPESKSQTFLRQLNNLAQISQYSAIGKFSPNVSEPAAEYGGELLSVIDDPHFGITTTNDIHNFANLANKYSELKQSIEEQYTGEELEKRLGYLSEAYDLAVGIYSNNRALGAEMKLSMEAVKVRFHNLMTQKGQPGLFEGGIIDADNEEFRNMIEKLVAGIKEATNHFAQMAKQFVLENGLISSEQHESDLVAYLMNAEKPKGGLSFSELNSINDVFNRNAEYNQANEPKDGDKFPHQLPLRKETMFSELKRLLSW